MDFVQGFFESLPPACQNRSDTPPFWLLLLLYYSVTRPCVYTCFPFVRPAVAPVVCSLFPSCHGLQVFNEQLTILGRLIFPYIRFCVFIVSVCV